MSLFFGKDKYETGSMFKPNGGIDVSKYNTTVTPANSNNVKYAIKTDKGYVLDCICVYADDEFDVAHVSEYTWNRSKALRYSDGDLAKQIAENLGGKVITFYVIETVHVFGDDDE